MPVYLRDGAAQKRLRSATLRQNLQIKLSNSPSYSILTPGQPVQALGARQGSHWRANVPVNVCLDPENSLLFKRESNPGSSTLEADALTIRASESVNLTYCNTETDGTGQPWYLTPSHDADTRDNQSEP